MNYPIEEVRKLIELFNLKPEKYELSQQIILFLKERSWVVEKVFKEAFAKIKDEPKPSRILVSCYNSFDFCDVVDVVKDFRVDDYFFYQKRDLLHVSMDEERTILFYENVFSDYEQDVDINLNILLLSDEEITERVNKSVSEKYNNWFANVNAYETWYREVYEPKLKELDEKRSSLVKAINS